MSRDGPRLVEAREADRTARLAASREATRVGFAALEQGDFFDFDSFDDLEGHLVDVTRAAVANGDQRK